jgi:hypothetical protein
MPGCRKSKPKQKDGVMPAKTKRRSTKKETSKPLLMVLMPIVKKPEEKPKDEEKDDGDEGEKDAEGDEEEGEDEVDEEKEEDLGDDVAKLKASLKAEREKAKKARQESIERRKKNKALADENERYKKGLAIIQGKDKPDLDPLEAAKKETEGKMRRAILKGELAVVAKDAHNPTELLALAPKAFADIEVDLENEVVDADALKEVVDGIRKEKPYLFASKDDEDDGLDMKDKSKPVKPPRGGPPTKGTKHVAQWKQLKAQGRQREAQEYAVKYNKEIQAEIAANPSLV